MAQRTQLDDANNPLHETYACLLANGLEGAGEALRILVNEASRIERAQHLQATPYERSAQRVDYANGYKSKTVLTRLGEVTFEVPQVRSGGFYPSALERDSRSEQAMNLALAEMYVQGRLYPQSDQRIAKAGGDHVDVCKSSCRRLVSSDSLKPVCIASSSNALGEQRSSGIQCFSSTSGSTRAPFGHLPRCRNRSGFQPYLGDFSKIVLHKKFRGD